jgi:hypothetical protein
LGKCVAQAAAGKRQSVQTFAALAEKPPQTFRAPEIEGPLRIGINGTYRAAFVVEFDTIVRVNVDQRLQCMFQSRRYSQAKALIE